MRRKLRGDEIVDHGIFEFLGVGNLSDETGLADTNWSDPDDDGKDNYPDSMLDFAFVAGPAKDWNPVCRAIVRDGDFPDDDTTSDHRPIELRLTPH